MRVLIESDIHGNIEALKAVNNYIVNKNTIDAIIILGDLIDYGPHSNEVINEVSSITYDIICNIRGNHEEAILKNVYKRFSSDRGKHCAKYTRSILNDDSWKYLLNVMEKSNLKEFEVNGKKCLAVHGSLIDPTWKAIEPDQDLSAYEKYDYVFSGHSHLPHIFAKYYKVDNPEMRNKKRTMFINPGSVGQPRNHNPRAQFIVWDTDTDDFQMCCVDYDIEKEQSAFSDSIDAFYRDRLTKGV